MADLAARHLGGSVVAASDDAFGAKEALLRPGPVAFEPGRYDHRGEVVDGWETRRHSPGGDWVVVRLGAPGVVRSVDVDTTSFVGNAPVSCRLSGCGAEGFLSPADLSDWQQLVPTTRLRPDASNVLTVTDPRRWTHLRLEVEPDGGVGRLRVHGDPLPDPRLLDGVTVDLAAEELGGVVTWCSDESYSPAAALLRPDPPRTMGEGWEARRRRGPGHDTVVVRLGVAGRPRFVEVDTTCFVHNATPVVALSWVGRLPGAEYDAADPAPDDAAWAPLLGRTTLQPDTRHRLAVAPGRGPTEATHVRLDADPDGGLARLRVLGSLLPPARAALGARWLDALPRGQAVALVGAAVADARPLGPADTALGRALDAVRRSGGDPSAAEPALRALLTGG